ncbi:PQQ-binding-like beta-propeller repeat protein [Streptomyces sp. NBC_01565]|uniref:outer membrane protein assembly factor BamB family protein n=1 Tax=unclassified Streptomyces TaxID=2593676 RepID=UPI00224FFE95|nr:PQQ-binding-like beta-propeller repeat protein [Streptomyces sp. NBC_01565]MCX4542404.1 PQQ-binding-like beta-propeller repeat protein [Streptomyces sp. NBC_01565]
MNKRSAFALATGTALVLGLTTGCGPDSSDGSKGGATASKSPSAGASASPMAPVYEGKPDPGLSKEPVWSRAKLADTRTTCPIDATETQRGGADVGLCAVGDAVVVTEELRQETGDGAQETKSVTRLLDAGTGKERAAFDALMSGEPAAVGRWKDGSPALLIRSVRAQDPTQVTYTMYAPDGRELGRSVFRGKEYLNLPVVDGHVKLPSSSNFEVKYAPIGGGAELTVNDVNPQNNIGPGFGYTPATKDDYDTKGGYLVVTDRRTGKQAWSTRDTEPPKAIAEINPKGNHPTAILKPLGGDRGIVLWTAKYGSDKAVIAVVDLATGRQVSQGPSVLLNSPGSEKFTVLSPDGKTAVGEFGKETVAWDIETGRELWRRGEEKPLRPAAISPSGVLYASVDGQQTLDARTGKPLSTYDQIPQFTTNGFGILTDAKALHVFRSNTAPAEGTS